MENKETKFGNKGIKNRIILKNLTYKQKEMLRRTGIIGGGAGLGTGLITLYSMKTPEIVPEISNDITTSPDSNVHAKNELSNSVEIVSLKPVTEITEQNISFKDAFKVAREHSGPGGWFIWRGNIYNTFYKEEWQDLSQTEKKDYLASIEIHNIQNYENQHIPDNQANKVNDIEESDQNVNLIQGEIITLDDDSDITDNGYFELPDDIEITTISEEESTLIDSITFDSTEIVSFPWEISTENTSKESIIIEQEVISLDLVEDTNDDKSADAPSEKEEYPWGEPINKPAESPVITQVHEEIQKDENTKIITNPDEIKEYPWGEPFENIENNHNQTSTETVIGEIKEESEQSHPDTFSVIEEYPWGEKNENFVPTSINQVSEDEEKENIGVILPEEHETEVLSHLPSSFNDITEFPWGETVPHSMIDPYNTPENDTMDNHSDPAAQ